MQRGPLGRRALSEELEIKNGIARGLLERLAEQNIIRVNENGVELTLTGKNKLQSLLDKLSVKKIVVLETSDLAPGPSAAVAHVRRAYRSGMTGVQQRDEAIKAGADGAITMTVKSGELRIPPDNAKISELAPAENKRLRKLLNTSDNDIVIIGFGQNPRRALAGALGAVLSLQGLREETSP
jgi:DNA-binding transcriptional regulator LsrR (DeoR family)